MQNNSESGIGRLDSLVKDGYGYLINNVGKIVAFITLVIAVLVTFTNISFEAFCGESFTVTLFVMLCASYIIYFSLEGSGERLGETTEEFKTAIKRYDNIRVKITPDSIEKLRDFCLAYTEKEANYRRRTHLSESGLSEDDYKSYKSGKKYPKKAVSAMKKYERIKPKRLTPALLMNRERSNSKSELISPERGRIFSLLLGLLPTTLGTFFTVSVILTTKSELGAGAILEGIIKLSALPLIGFKGYSSGYSYAKNQKSSWISTKAGILEEFIEKT